jgi:hypothetical protein
MTKRKEPERGKKISSLSQQKTPDKRIKNRKMHRK